MKKIIMFLSLALLASCNEAVVFSESDRNFDDNRWITEDIKKFEFEIKQDIASADIFVEFSHIYEPQYDDVPVVIEIKSSHGETERIAVLLELKDSSGKDITECLGDICDLRQLVKDNASLPKGNYTITIQNKFPSQYLPNVLGIGIRVENQKK